MFGSIKKAFKAGKTEINAAYSENRDFLEAVCAASALIAAADGDLEDSERQKAVRILTNHPVLGKLYKQNDIENCLESMFKRAKDNSGRLQLARELDDIKKRDTGAQMGEDVYLIASDVAGADGEVDDKEKEMLKKIAGRLGVDPARLEF